jgi:monovalent cation/hydrogen antiporter
VVQGGTVRPLLTRLRLRDDGTVDREVRLARVETLRAALSATTVPRQTEAAAFVRRRYELQLRRAEAQLASDDVDARALLSGGDGNESESPDSDGEIVRAAMTAERQRLLALRAEGTIGDAAFQQVEQELDWAELDHQQLFRSE